MLLKDTRQAMYISRTVEALSCNHCCSGKTISIAYSQCVFIALGIQNAMRMRYIVISYLPGSTMCFPHYVTNGTILEKKSYCVLNMCFDFLYNCCLKLFSF
jgi:hypothetical protein